MPAPLSNSVLQSPMITQRRKKDKYTEGPELCVGVAGGLDTDGFVLGAWQFQSLWKVSVCVGWGAVTEEYRLQDNDLHPPTITYTLPAQVSHPETPPLGSCSCSFLPLQGRFHPQLPVQGRGRVGMNLRSLDTQSP